MKYLRSRLAWAAVAGALLLLLGLSPTVLAQGQSTDATLSSLTLSDIDFGTFASGTSSYTASVADTVTETTVTPTTSHSGASYVIKLGGVTDDAGEIPLAAGSNVITVEVTAEDGQTTQTYTVTVTRPASTDATLSGVSLTGVDFGAFASGTTSYTGNAANRVQETTVTPTVNHSGASYVIKLDGVEDTDGTVALSVGSNVITVEVIAEDGNTTQTYTVTATRAENTPATGKPVITGTAEVGETLTVDVSSIADEDGIAGFGDAAWSFQWSDSCYQVFGAWYIYDDSNPGLYAALGGEKQKSWEIPWNAAGAAVQVKVIFYDGGGDRERLVSDFTAVVPGPVNDLTLVDTSDQSDMATLDCDDDQEIVLDATGTYTVRADLADGADVGSISWNWDYSDFTGTDNAAPYVLFGEDENGSPVGRQMSASADRFGGHDLGGRVYSGNSGEVQLIRASFFVTHDTPATGVPTISGTAQVGQTLTASTSDISDADGLTNVSYSYQWLADDTEIDGATSSTHTLQSSDEDKVIKVRVDFRDDAKTRESLTSEGTEAVVMGGL